MPDNRSFLDFDGRWVVVTGASSGLGRAVAIEVARHGARVILVGRDEARLAETAASFIDTEYRVLRLDLSRHDSIAPEIGRIHQETGPIYGMCHAAGIVETRPLQANKVEIIQRQLDVNLLAGLELARAVCRRDVMTSEGGSLVFISSVYGRVGMPGQTGYCATKGAVTAAVRAMAIELARRNIRVNSLSPGLVFTGMTEQALGLLSAEHVERLKTAYPLGPGQPEDVARAAVFLLAPGTRWITGADLAVDGGFTAQ
jgi:NAD(P)-dependent dehydrogenase (short-subunit alcohol dehydrogenase family)